MVSLPPLQRPLPLAELCPPGAPDRGLVALLKMALWQVRAR